MLHCSSFSKSLAPGYRIGWVAAGRFRQAVARHKLVASLATSVPMQLGLARYLERGSYARHLRDLRATLKRQQAEYLEAIGRIFPATTRASRPTGGYFLWLQLPDGVDALALHHAAMAAGISIAPGPMFSPAREFRSHVRINAGWPMTPRVEAALRTLRGLM